MANKNVLLKNSAGDVLYPLIADSSVTTNKLAKGSVTKEKLANDAKVDLSQYAKTIGTKVFDGLSLSLMGSSLIATTAQNDNWVWLAGFDIEDGIAYIGYNKGYLAIVNATTWQELGFIKLASFDNNHEDPNNGVNCLTAIKQSDNSVMLYVSAVRHSFKKCYVERLTKTENDGITTYSSTLVSTITYNGSKMHTESGVDFVVDKSRNMLWLIGITAELTGIFDAYKGRKIFIGYTLSNIGSGSEISLSDNNIEIEYTAKETKETTGFTLQGSCAYHNKMFYLGSEKIINHGEHQRSKIIVYDNSNKLLVRTIVVDNYIPNLPERSECEGVAIVTNKSGKGEIYVSYHSYEDNINLTCKIYKLPFTVEDIINGGSIFYTSGEDVDRDVDRKLENYVISSNANNKYNKIYTLSVNNVTGKIVDGNYIDALQAANNGKLVFLKFVVNGTETKTSSVIPISGDGELLFVEYQYYTDDNDDIIIDITKHTVTENSVVNTSTSFYPDEVIEEYLDSSEPVTIYLDKGYKGYKVILDNSANASDATVHYTYLTNAEEPVGIKWGGTPINSIKAKTIVILRFEHIEDTLYLIDSKEYTKESDEKINTNGYEYVDLGLPSGTLWATTNVGASSPSEAGLYFQWGDTQGYTADLIGTSVGLKLFSWNNYKLSPRGDGETFTKYTTTGATLELADDAVSANMGGDWHMPNIKQLQELIDNTTNIWTTLDGVNGRLFTSKKDTSKTIFIPAIGNAWGSSLDNRGNVSFIWSSELYTEYNSHSQYLRFDSSSIHLDKASRCSGFLVRGVIR